MEIIVYAVRFAIYLVTGAAAVELLAALFSTRVRRYIVRHPVAHVLWFACALLLALFLVPAPSTPQHRQDDHQGVFSPNQAVERMAAGGSRPRTREPWAAAIAHFYR